MNPKAKIIAKIVLQVLGLLVSWWLVIQSIPVVLSKVPLTSGFNIISEITLITPLIFLALLFLSKPVNLIGYTTGWIDRRQLWGVSIYAWASFVISVSLLAFLIYNIPIMLAAGENPLFSYFFEGHWSSWFALSLVIFWFGKKDIIKGLVAGSFLYSGHELVWFVSSIAQFANSDYTGESFAAGFVGVFRDIVVAYLPLAITVITMLMAYFIAFRIFTWRRELLIIAIPAVWGALQLIIAFPNTLTLGQATSDFNTWWVNMAEVLSWILPAIVALWPNKIKPLPLKQPEQLVPLLNV